MARNPVRTTLALLLLAGLAHATPLSAQSAGEALRGGYPELAGLFDAADVTQAEMYDRLLAITESAESAGGGNALRALLIRSMTMSMAEMMAEMQQMGGMGMGTMPGPFGDLALRWCLGPFHRSGRLLALTDQRLRSHTSRSPSSVRVGSTVLTSRDSGTMTEAIPPVATVATRPVPAPSTSSRIRASNPSTRPA